MLRYEANYNEIEEEVIKHAVNRNGIDANRFINRCRTIDLIRGADATLNHMPEDKERSNKDNVRNELNNPDDLPINEINTGNNNQVSIEKVTANLQNNADNNDLSNCEKETNEEITDKDDFALTVKKLVTSIFRKIKTFGLWHATKVFCKD